jgi:hypothetical protein
VTRSNSGQRSRFEVRPGRVAPRARQPPTRLVELERNFHTNGDAARAALYARARDIAKLEPAELVEELGLDAALDAFDIVVGGPPRQAYTQSSARLPSTPAHTRSIRGATFTCDSFTTCGSRTRWPSHRRQVLDLGLDLVLECGNCRQAYVDVIPISRIHDKADLLRRRVSTDRDPAPLREQALAR